MSVKVSCVEADRVDITIAEYNDLVRASEKIASIERLFSVNEYVSRADIIALLDIKEKKTEERETEE